VRIEISNVEGKKSRKNEKLRINELQSTHNFSSLIKLVTSSIILEATLLLIVDIAGTLHCMLLRDGGNSEALIKKIREFTSNLQTSKRC
jgi:hypothetical protein